MPKNIKRILLVTPYFYPAIGGSQKYAEELYYFLMKRYPEFEVDVICYNTQKTKRFEKYRRFNIYRIPALQILPNQFALPNYYSLFKLINKLFSKNHYQLINCHTRFFDSTIWCLLLAKKYKVPLILTDHCANHPYHRATIIRLMARFIDKTIVTYLIKRYPHIITTNYATHKFINDQFKVNPQVIYGGVDTEYFNRVQLKKRELPKLSRAFTDKDIIISFVGRMIDTKNPQLLMSVAQQLAVCNKKLFFVFAGDGPLYKHLVKNQNKQIVFLGKLDRSQIRQLLGMTDIFVHPSIHHEGFPNAILEAGSSGCAIIATDQGGTREIISSKNLGLIIKPDQLSLTTALNYLITNKKLRNNMGNSLRQYAVKNFDWRQIAIKFKIYLDKITSW